MEQNNLVSKSNENVCNSLAFNQTRERYQFTGKKKFTEVQTFNNSQYLILLAEGKSEAVVSFAPEAEDFQQIEDYSTSSTGQKYLKFKDQAVKNTVGLKVTT